MAKRKAKEFKDHPWDEMVSIPRIVLRSMCCLLEANTNETSFAATWQESSGFEGWIFSYDTDASHPGSPHKVRFDFREKGRKEIEL